MPPNTWIAVSPTEANLPANALARRAARCRSCGLGRVGGPQRVDDSAAREFDGLVHVDAQVLDGLEAADRLVELSAHLRVFDGQLHHRGGGAKCVGCPRDDDVVDECLDDIGGRVCKASRCHAVEDDIEQLVRRVDVGPWRHGDAVRGGVDGVEGSAVVSVREYQQHARRGDVGHRGHLAAQCLAIGGGPRTGQRADSGNDCAVGDPRQSSPSSAPVRASARAAATALDNHGPA